MRGNSTFARRPDPMHVQRSFPFSLKIFLLSLPLCFVAASLHSGPLPQAQTDSEKKAETAKSPRGIRLMLKDGTYHIVREYQRNGDRVRYFSIERSEWEELPAALVDWDATTKENAAANKESAALVEKVHKQEQGKRMDNVTDIDASLKVGPAAFLPSGEGMFLVEGNSIRILDQAGSEMKTDKKRAIERVLTPVPLVPGKRNMVIPGPHAKLRLHSNSPEFYLREIMTDQDRTTAVQKSSKAADNGPDVVLIRTKVKGKERLIQAISVLFGEEISASVDTVSIQRWEVAPDVYRFTMGEQLTPGEYVLAEVLPDGLNLFVWDFGLD